MALEQPLWRWPCSRPNSARARALPLLVRAARPLPASLSDAGEHGLAGIDRSDSDPTFGEGHGEVSGACSNVRRSGAWSGYPRCPPHGDSHAVAVDLRLDGIARVNTIPIFKGAAEVGCGFAGSLVSFEDCGRPGGRR
jgi:hypothetical protein